MGKGTVPPSRAAHHRLGRARVKVGDQGSGALSDITVHPGLGLRFLLRLELTVANIFLSTDTS